MSPDYATYTRNRAAMLTLYGVPREPHDITCPACMAWAIFNSTGRVPASAEACDAASDAAAWDVPQ